ncbi:hypothetical protein TrCOL_g13593 [Triparma columacea]|jgi:hypothetical protein|uniref:Flagellar associated protein n=1 Tax=Triparma columacea TaxID=722753 RepID=A0A9W7GLH7_9STRA|nr:hypothetical protein TrCOL_g13593 [Triparma columacea]
MMQTSQSATDLMMGTDTSGFGNTGKAHTGRVKKLGRSLMDSFYATHKSQPAIGFGTSTRPPLNETTAEAPGPGAYSIKTTVLGNFPESKIRTAPQFSLRSREKFGSPMTKAEDTTTIMEPGPGHYKSKIVNDRERNAPKYSIPKSRWLKDKDRGTEPGPGAYKAISSCDKQVLSTKRNFMPGKFGRGKRPPLILVSTADVGPGEYGCGIGACDAQVDSRKKTLSNIKFAHSGREQAPIGSRIVQENIPGPGHYKLPKGLGGKGSGYVYRCSPQPRLSGREKFGSPFGW